MKISFEEFYRTTSGNAPFDWQANLAERVMNGAGWPATTDLPTGTGKTCLLHIALWSMLVMPHSPWRIAYVVNRRSLVNSSHSTFVKIARCIENADTRGNDGWSKIARAMEERFGSRELKVLMLRGGIGEPLAKIDSATAPLLVFGTIDQLGSQLLLRGYGVSDLHRPIPAGLLSHDSLWLLDEAHISDPFLRTLRSVERMTGESAKTTGLRPMRVVAMTATPRRDDDLFSLEGIDKALKPRLEVHKRPVMDKVSGRADLAEKMVRYVRDALAGGSKRILVVSNRVKTARDVHDLLKQVDDIKTSLLIGSNRAVSAEDVVGEGSVFARMTSGTPENDTPLVLVATQTVEIGVDLNADCLITESASLDALIQRFGRLNRNGSYSKTQCVIVHVSDSKNDAIYGAAIQSTWKWLGKKPDFQILSMSNKVRALPLKERLDLFCASKNHEPLTWEHAERFAQTYPRLKNGPEPAAFLHGRRSDPEMTIIWRDGVKAFARNASGEDSMPKMFGREGLALPARNLLAWINHEDDDAALMGDVPTDDPNVPGSHTKTPRTREQSPWPMLAWNVDKSMWEKVPDLKSLRSKIASGYSVVAVDSEAIGGCDEFGWNPSMRGDVKDVMESAAFIRAKENPEKVRRFVMAVEGNEEEDEDEEDVAVWLVSGRTNVSERELRRGSFRLHRIGGTIRYVVWTAAGIGHENRFGIRAGKKAISLQDHLEGVRRLATDASDRIDLPKEAREAVILAAFTHDIGKADPRFQYEVLGNDNPHSTDPKVLLGKSSSMNRGNVSTWQKGQRHEAVSLRMMREIGALVRHLVGTHHGFGRPGFPMVSDKHRVPVSLELEGVSYVSDGVLPASPDIHDRWWTDFEVLNDTWGVWGLAYLEAIVRLADHQCSEEEQI